MTSGLLEDEPRRSAYVAALAVCVANLLAYFAVGAVMPVLPLYMREELRVSDVTVGIVMGSYAVTTLAGRPLGGRWGDRAGIVAPRSPEAR
jgi:MFS family permease